MMKNLKVYAIVALILINFGFVFYARANHVRIGNVDASIISISPPNYAINPSGNKLEIINSLDEIMDKSSLVALIKVTSEKTYYLGASQCTAMILKTFKGDQELTTINMFEDLSKYIEADNEVSMYTNEGYVPLIEGKEYIVFLNETKNNYYDDAYMYADKLITKFQANQLPLKIIEIENNTTLPMAAVAEVDYVNILWDEEQKAEFLRIDEVYRAIKVEFNERYDY